MAKRLASIYEFGGEATSSKRNLPMEGLRGFAVTLVFFVHYNGLLNPWLSPDSHSFALSNFLGSIGHSGVDLFFVLSGYLIYGSIIKKHRSYFSFIRRRIQRIYPTFLCVFAIYLLLSILFPGENKIPANANAGALYILENVLLLPGLFNIQPIITVAWSLSYEFFYYLFIPVLVGILGMRQWRPSIRVVFFIGLAIAFTGYCVVGHHPHIRLIMFISGILLFEARHSFNLGENLGPRSDSFVTLLLFATFPLIYALVERPELFPFLPNVAHFGEVYRIALLFVSFFIFTLACFSLRSFWSRIFSWTPIRWLGNMSYSYYLIHGLTLKAVALVMLHVIHPSGNQMVAFWLGLPISFFLTLVTATILFVLVERRFSLMPGSSRQIRNEVISSGEDKIVPLPLAEKRTAT